MIDHSKQGKENREWGREAEQIAADWLLTHGYVVRERNWRCSNHIEVDIIAELPGRIIFVEVKARKGDVVKPIEAIDDKKIKKMVKGADIYLQNEKYLFQYRFDIITITGTPEDYTVSHIEDAFMPPLKRR
ncbi:MAG: YraN family protein [Muribaculaceae bacterium]|nr:YraN family protein [Muribaculaceae bacterium]